MLRRPRSLFAPRASRGGLAVQALFGLLLPLAMLPLALRSRDLALICAGLLLLAVAAPVFGLARIGGLLVIGGFAAAPMNSLHPVASLPGIELSDLLFVAGFVLLIPRFIAHPVHLPFAFVAGEMVFLAIGALSALATGQAGANFNLLLQVSFGVLLMPLLVAWWSPNLRTTIAAASAYLLGNCINVASNLTTGSLADKRYEGWSTHPNVMGLCLALGLALTPFLLRAVPAGRHWLIGIGAAISLFGIWISGSRAALLCTLAIAAIFPLLRRSIPAALWVTALCFPALFVLDRVAAHPDDSSALGRLLGGGGAGASDTGRAEAFRIGLNIAKHHPVLGDGWVGIWAVHDVYIQVAAAIGMIGLAAYLVITAALVRPLVTVRQPYGLLSVAALAGSLIGAVDPGLGAHYIWCVMSLSLVAAPLAAAADSPDSSVSGSPAGPGTQAVSGDASAPRANAKLA